MEGSLTNFLKQFQNAPRSDQYSWPTTFLAMAQEPESIENEETVINEEGTQCHFEVNEDLPVDTEVEVEDDGGSEKTEK